MNKQPGPQSQRTITAQAECAVMWGSESACDLIRWEASEVPSVFMPQRDEFFTHASIVMSKSFMMEHSFFFWSAKKGKERHNLSGWNPINHP